MKLLLDERGHSGHPKRGSKSEHRSTHERRAERQAEAQERQEAREKRSVVEQLNLLKKRPGKSTKESRRLRRALDRQVNSRIRTLRERS